MVGGDIPERLAAAAASWAALAVYLMHEQRPAGGRRAEAAAREEARAAAARLLPSASAALVADLAAPFTNGSGFPVDPDAVMHVTGLVAQEDPLADAIDALASARPEWSVHRHDGRRLHLQSGGRGTFLQAAAALESVPGDTDAAVWATGPTPAGRSRSGRGRPRSRRERRRRPAPVAALPARPAGLPHRAGTQPGTRGPVPLQPRRPQEPVPRGNTGTAGNGSGPDGRDAIGLPGLGRHGLGRLAAVAAGPWLITPVRRPLFA